MRRLLVIAFAGCGFQPGSATELADAPSRDAPHDVASIIDVASTVDAPSDGEPLTPIVFRQLDFAEDVSRGNEGITFGSAQASGDLNVIVIGWYKAGNLVSVTDTSHNTYAVASGPTMIGTTPEIQAIYYACNIAAASAGSNTVKVTFDGSGQDPDVRIVEYSGIATTACLDTSVASTGSGVAIDSGDLHTAHAHELVLAADKVFNLTSAGDPSFATRTITPFGDIVEDLEVSTLGTFHALATENEPGVWVMQIVAFDGR